MLIPDWHDQLVSLGEPVIPIAKSEPITGCSDDEEDIKIEHIDSDEFESGQSEPTDDLLEIETIDHTVEPDDCAVQIRANDLTDIENYDGKDLQMEAFIPHNPDITDSGTNDLPVFCGWLQGKYNARGMKAIDAVFRRAETFV